MGKLDHTSVSNVVNQSGTPIPFADVRICYVGTDRLAVLYQDSNLTHLQDNPVRADGDGRVEDIFLIDGDYRVVIKDRYDTLLEDVASVQVKTESTGGTAETTDFTFGSVTDLSNNVSLSYVPGFGLEVVQAGMSVAVEGRSFQYAIVEQTESEPDFVTAGGVKLVLTQIDPNVVEAEAFGLVADTGLDQLAFAQKAVDYTTQSGRGVVTFPRGTIVLDGTLRVGNTGSGLEAVKLQGVVGSFLGNTQFLHGAGQTQNPMINIAGTRMVEIADIELRGNNVAPTAQINETYVNANYADWITPGCSAGRYNPYAGIALAALHGTDPGAGQGYDFDAYGQGGLPSKIFLSRVRIQNFVVGIILAPNAGTPGVEDILVRDSSLIENTFAICSTGSQQRNCIVDNCNINGHYCIVDGVTFGLQGGQPINITNSNFGKSANVFQCSTDVGQNVISSTYFENVRAFGLIGTTPSGASHSALIQGCNLSMNGHGTSTSSFNKDTVSSVAMPTKVDSCSIVSQAILLAKTAAPIKFENCLFRSMASGSSAQEVFGIYPAQGEKGRVLVRGCGMQAYSGTTPLFLNDCEDVVTLPTRAFVSRNTYEVFEHSNRQRYQITPHPIEYRGPNVQNVSYDSDDQISFDFTVQADRPILVGDLIYWRVFVPQKNDPEADTMIAPAIRVTSISGTTATCDILAYVDTSYSPTNIDIHIPNFVNAVEATGDTTAGSADIANVTNISNFKVGDWIVASDPDLPQQIRVVGISGSTLVCHRTMNRTGNVSIYNARLVAV